LVGLLCNNGSESEGKEATELSPHNQEEVLFA